MKLSIITILDGYKKDQWTGLGLEPGQFPTIDIEIVAVLNGPQPVDSILPKFIRKIPLDAHRSTSEAINLAVETCSSDYILLAVHPRTDIHGLERSVLKLSNSDAGGYSGQILTNSAILATEGYLLNDGTISWPQRFQPKDQVSDLTPNYTEVCTSLGLLIDRKFFQSIGGFSCKFSSQIYEDADLTRRAAIAGRPIEYSPGLTIQLLGKTESELYSLSDSSFAADQLKISELAKYESEVPAEIISTKKLSLSPHPTFHSMRIGIHTPFAIGPGGGERYIFTIYRMLEQMGAYVELVTPRPYAADYLSSTFENLGLEGPSINNRSLHELTELTYDLYISMGNDLAPSHPGFGLRNLYHCQFPFPTKNKVSKSYIRDFSKIVVNSAFTQKAVAQKLPQKYKIPVSVVNPPVPQILREAESRDPFRIVSVGRFFTGDHTKQQDKLIQAFQILHRMEPRFTLELLGGIAPGQIHDDYVSHCMTLARGLPIKFKFDASQQEVRSALLKSSFFWHAAGLDVNENSHPEKTEHFGISILEAMSTGSIPFVVGNGGPMEFVVPQENGYLYSSIEELVKLTILAQSNDQGAMRNNAMFTASRYSDEIFAKNFENLLMDMGLGSRNYANLA